MPGNFQRARAGYPEIVIGIFDGRTEIVSKGRVRDTLKYVHFMGNFIALPMLGPRLVKLVKSGRAANDVAPLKSSATEIPGLAASCAFKSMPCA